MSIKRKLTLLMIGVSLAAVMLTVTGIATYLIYDMRKGKVQELKVTAAMTGERNNAALLFLDKNLAMRNLDMFRLSASVLAACIYDAQGQLFAGYHSPESEVQCPKGSDEATLSQPNWLTTLQPIGKEEKLGSIYMVADTHEIDVAIYKIVLISATVALLVLAVILLVTMYLQRTISRPILELAATVQAITASRSYDHSLNLRASDKDETGILVGAFNKMLQEVRKRDQELVQANESLEIKVKSRTEQLEEAKRRAEKANDIKSEFLRNMSHEFRTPLHAMISFSTYGKQESETATPAELHRYFEMILKGANRLSKLVNEVLDLAQLEQGEQKLTMKKADLREIAQHAAELITPLMQDKNISLRYQTHPALIQCDSDKLLQVFTNLLGNAVKFTPKGRTITLYTEIVDGRAVASVIDEGIGIPEDEKELIFESFQQSSRTNKGAGGTGLGLAICRSILEAHGGSIHAENNRTGVGANFTLSLPLAEGETTTLQHKEKRNGNASAA